MARLPRYFAPNCPQHVILRGNNRAPIFAAEADYAKFYDCLEDSARNHDVVIHAYVFMTNHLHLLATPGSEQALGKTMQSLERQYVQYFNYTYRRSGRRPTGSCSGRRWGRRRCSRFGLRRTRRGRWAAIDSGARWRRWQGGVRRRCRKAGQDARKVESDPI